VIVAEPALRTGLHTPVPGDLYWASSLSIPERRRTPGYDCAMRVTPGRAALLAAVLAFVGGGALTLPRVLAGGPPVGADAPAYCRIARTVVATGSLELPGPDLIDRDIQQDLSSPFGTPYALTRDGRLFPKHSALFGLALAPGTALAVPAADGGPPRPAAPFRRG